MLDYRLGGKYRISTVNRGKKIDNRFTGELIRHSKRHLTLEDSRGIRETFLKIDFVIGEYGIEVI